MELGSRVALLHFLCEKKAIPSCNPSILEIVEGVPRGAKLRRVGPCIAWISANTSTGLSDHSQEPIRTPLSTRCSLSILLLLFIIAIFI